MHKLIAYSCLDWPMSRKEEQEYKLLERPRINALSVLCSETKTLSLCSSLNEIESKDDYYLYSKNLNKSVQIQPFYNVLTVGEADYSFARAYKTVYPYCNMQATRYENSPIEESCFHKISDNFHFLEKRNVDCLEGIDATKLNTLPPITKFKEEHSITEHKGFDRIFFNFPYPVPTGTRVDPTEAINTLLTQFGANVKSLLSPLGKVVIGGYSDDHRQHYYTPTELVDMGYKLEESSWDPYGYFATYGYEHRDSNKDSSTNPQPREDNAKMYSFSKDYFRLEETQAFLKGNNYLNQDGSVNIKVNDQEMRREINDFCKENVVSAKEIIHTLETKKRDQILSNIRTTQESHSWNEAKKHYEKLIRPYLEFFSDQQILNFVDAVNNCNNGQLSYILSGDFLDDWKKCISEINRRELQVKCVQRVQLVQENKRCLSLKDLFKNGLTVDLNVMKSLVRANETKVVYLGLQYLQDFSHLNDLLDLADQLGYSEIRWLLKGFDRGIKRQKLEL